MWEHFPHDSNDRCVDLSPCIQTPDEVKVGIVWNVSVIYHIAMDTGKEGLDISWIGQPVLTARKENSGYG